MVLPSKAILPYGNSITFETALKVLIYNQGNFESREKEGSVNSWFSHLSVCNVHSRFFIFFWIKILNSQFHTPPTPHLAKPAKTWLILSTFWALKRELKLAKFPGKEYGKMIGRWTNWHNIKIISRKWDEQIDTILTSFSGKEYGKMMRSSAAKLARMDFQVV